MDKFKVEDVLFQMFVMFINFGACKVGLVSFFGEELAECDFE